MKKILVKIYNTLSKKKLLISFLSRNKQALLSAIFLSTYEKKIPIDLKSDNRKKHRILVLSTGKSGFLQDIEETFQGSDDFDLITWPSTALRSIASEFLAPSVNDNNYLDKDPEIVASKKAYEKFLSSLWNYYSSIRKIDLVLSPNFFYHSQRALASILEKKGTPFIVLHKENLKSPGRVEYWRYMYKRRGKFSGRKILVYNDTERKLLLSAGVVGKDGVVVTGMPRLDKIHRWRSQQSERATAKQPLQVLFFAFDKNDKLPKEHQWSAYAEQSDPKARERWGGLSWAHVCKKTHEAMVELARRRPDVSVVVKTKGTERHRRDTSQLLKADGKSLPPNLKVVTGGDPFLLLTQSSVIVGFNTTAQLEALAAGKPVIVPWFDEAVDPKTRDFVVDLGDAVEYARSPDQIVEIACRLVDRPSGQHRELRASDARALDQWTGNNDGAAGKRVLDMIRKEI